MNSRAIRPCLEGWLSHVDQATGLAVTNTDHRCGTVPESHRLRCIPHEPTIAGPMTVPQSARYSTLRFDALSLRVDCTRNEVQDWEVQDWEVQERGKSGTSDEICDALYSLFEICIAESERETRIPRSTECFARNDGDFGLGQNDVGQFHAG